MTKAYQERLIALVRDTVTLLCKNGLEYSQEFCVEGLLGVTLDKDEVFLIPIKELVADKGVGTGDVPEDVSEKSSLAGDGLDMEEGYKSPRPEKRRRQKRRHVNCKTSQDEGDTEQNTSQSELIADSNNSSNAEPSPKRQNKDGKHTDISQVKEEDIVVIKEEIDDQQFLDTFHNNQSSANTSEPTDNNSMSFMPQPGTSGIGFSLDQLARDSGLPSSVSGMLPGSIGGDTTWLQNSQGETGDSSREWQTQGHQWQCGICLKSFGRRSWLKRHTDSVHLKLKLAECEICGKAYSNKGNLNAHKRAAHSISHDNTLNNSCTSKQLNIGDPCHDQSNALSLIAEHSYLN